MKKLLYIVFVFAFCSCNTFKFLKKDKCTRKIERLQGKCPSLFVSSVDTIRDTITIPKIEIDTVYEYRSYYDTSSVDSAIYNFLKENNIRVEKSIVYQLRDLSCEECLRAIFMGDGLVTKSQGVTSKVYFKDGNIINEITVDEKEIFTETLLETTKIEKSFYDEFKTNIFWFILIVAVVYLLLRLYSANSKK